jgi:hypothetical protein
MRGRGDKAVPVGRKLAKLKAGSAATSEQGTPECYKCGFNIVEAGAPIYVQHGGGQCPLINSFSLPYLFPTSIPLLLPLYPSSRGPSPCISAKLLSKNYEVSLETGKEPDDWRANLQQGQGNGSGKLQTSQ